MRHRDPEGSRRVMVDEEDAAHASSTTILVDCEQGIRMGCRAFCCRLIVRLGPRDPPAYDAHGRRKSCVDKDPATGLCIHLDPDTRRCRIWERRPWVCRDYDCNVDPLLQIVLREGFVSLRRLVTAAVPRADSTKVSIPKIDE